MAVAARQGKRKQKSAGELTADIPGKRVFAGWERSAGKNSFGILLQANSLFPKERFIDTDAAFHKPPCPGKAPISAAV